MITLPFVNMVIVLYVCKICEVPEIAKGMKSPGLHGVRYIQYWHTCLLILFIVR